MDFASAFKFVAAIQEYATKHGGDFMELYRDLMEVKDDILKLVADFPPVFFATGPEVMAANQDERKQVDDLIHGRTQVKTLDPSTLLSVLMFVSQNLMPLIAEYGPAIAKLIKQLFARKQVIATAEADTVVVSE